MGYLQEHDMKSVRIHLGSQLYSEIVEICKTYLDLEVLELPDLVA